MARRLASLVVMIVLLVSSGMLVEPMHRLQVKHDLTNAPLRGSSPGVVLATTALGAFRGLILDVVWIRMEGLKQDGKVFEIAQLAQLACRLAPNFPKVWDYNSWNMAYNVTADIPVLRDRWPWVKQGIEILRDEGIPNNRTEPYLYFSLGWLYANKISGDLDNAHFYYKQALGLEMHKLLQGPGTEEFLKRLAAAPKSDEELLTEAYVQNLHDELLAQGFDPLANGADGALMYMAFARSPESVAAGTRAILGAVKHAEAVELLDTYCRARELARIKLDPQKMLALMAEYGPLDWRGAPAHAIYWATEGMLQAAALVGRIDTGKDLRGSAGPRGKRWAYETQKYEYHSIKYDRVIYMALKRIVESGRLIFDSRGVLLNRSGPDFRFTDTMIRQFEMVNSRYEDERFAMGTTEGYRFFLINTIQSYYFMGDNRGADRYLALLKLRYPKEIRFRYGRKVDFSKVEVEQFVLDTLSDDLNTMSAEKVRNVVGGILNQSYFQAAAHDEEKSARFWRLAKGIADGFNGSVGPGGQGARNYINFEEVRQTSLRDIFSGMAGVAPEMMDALWEQLSVKDQRMVQAYLSLLKQTPKLKVAPESKEGK